MKMSPPTVTNTANKDGVTVQMVASVACTLAVAQGVVEGLVVGVP